MSTPNNRRKEPGAGMGGEQVLLFVGVGAVVAALLVVDGGVLLGHRLAGLDQPLPGDPFELFFAVLDGRVTWPVQSTVVAAAAGVLLLALTVIVAVAVSRSRSKRTRVDRSARYMGRGRDIEALNLRNATATAARLGVTDSPGVPIGRTVSTGQSLYGSWEDMLIDISGPRTGKTTSRAIPAILEAPGAVLVTSNKRDIVDATRSARPTGGPAWVFDPQGIAAQEPTWWWNPLSYVTDEVKAARLAEHFAAGSREAGARGDAYFDPAGQDLLAAFLLAAALDDRPITDVYGWLTNPIASEQTQGILRDAGYALLASQVAGVINAPDKQRGGIYGTAQQMAACLTNRATARWVTTQGQTEGRAHFDPADFVRGNGTLYSLSKEGRGSAGPLVTALTVAVVEAAEELATRSPGGRLRTPLLGVLDEAANVCRWRELPNLYSHYGSRGIVLMTILQSWSQGVEVWGEHGMKKLWSASNVRTYGGGSSDTGFLEDLSRTIGDYDRATASVSTGSGKRTVSQQLHRERILDVADLAALPRGRAVVFASGSRPTLIATQPWSVGRHAEAVKASIARHDPKPETALAAAQAATAEVGALEQVEAMR